MAGPAVLFAVVAAQGSASGAALATAALAAATGIAGPFVGAALDAARSPLHVTAMAMLWMAGWLSVLTVGVQWPLAAVVAVAFLAGLAGPVLSGGWTAQLSAVVRPEELPRATAVDAATYNLAGIVGPALAGAFAGSFGARFGVVGAALALLAAIPLALSVRLAPAADRVKSRVDRGFRARRVALGVDLRAATIALTTNRSLSYATLVTTIGYAGLGAALVAAQLLGSEFTRSAGAGGYLIAAFAAGGLGGTMAMARWPVDRRPDGVITAAAVLVGVAFLAVAAAPTYLAAVALFAVAGVADGALLAATLSIRHREAPVAVRAQLFTTAASLKIAAYSLGLAVSGALFAHGQSAALAAGTAHLVAVAVGLVLCLSRPTRKDDRRVSADAPVVTAKIGL